VWDYCSASASLFFGTSTGDYTADRILEAINASTGGFLSRNQMSALFHGHLSSSRIEAALEQLLSLGAIYQSSSQPTGGRPLPSGLRYQNRSAWPRESHTMNRHLRKQPTRNQCRSRLSSLSSLSSHISTREQGVNVPLRGDKWHSRTACGADLFHEHQDKVGKTRSPGLRVHKVEVKLAA
jgi:hypothetical protein